MGLVDEQQRAVRSADAMQFPQRREVAVGTEHRVGQDERAGLGARREGVRDRVDVVVRGDDDPRAGQPARVDERGVAAGVRHDQCVPATEGGDGTEVGGVSAREHQAAVGPDEVGEFAFEELVFGGGAGDQARSGGTGSPSPQGGGGPREDLGMAGQAEIVVGGEVDDGRAGGPDDGVAVQARCASRRRGAVEPRQGGMCGHER